MQLKNGWDGSGGMRGGEPATGVGFPLTRFV